VYSSSSARKIQTYIERLVDTASSSSTLAFLRILHLARSSTSALVEDLKNHEFFRSASASLERLDFVPQTSQSVGISGPANVGSVAVSVMLDQTLEELFVPYMEGTRYVDKEGKSLTELYAGYLLRFMNWHVRANSLLAVPAFPALMQMNLFPSEPTRNPRRRIQYSTVS
jgi:exocyst complex component 5